MSLLTFWLTSLCMLYKAALTSSMLDFRSSSAHTSLMAAFLSICWIMFAVTLSFCCFKSAIASLETLVAIYSWSYSVFLQFSVTNCALAYLASIYFSKDNSFSLNSNWLVLASIFFDSSTSCVNTWSLISFLNERRCSLCCILTT